ncbi:MAG: GxxExxY protein, partial [Acidimicrobiia bacterium]
MTRYPPPTKTRTQRQGSAECEVYEEALVCELQLRGLEVERQKSVPVKFSEWERASVPRHNWQGIRSPTHPSCPHFASSTYGRYLSVAKHGQEGASTLSILPAN